MSLTPLPTAPSRARPATFSSDADAMLGALPNMVAELNSAMAGETALGLASDLQSPAVGKGSKLVIFIQRLTGAISRWVEDKLSENVSVLDFGADPTGLSDSSVAVTAALTASRHVHFPAGTYAFNVAPSAWFRLTGDGMNSSIIKPFNTSLPCIKSMYITGNWDYASVSDIGFVSASQTGIGFSFGNAAGYTTGQEFIGRTTFTRCKFDSFDKGVFKVYGNIGNVFKDCLWTNNNYGVYAQDANRGGGGVMHPFADRYEGGHFDHSVKAACMYLSRTAGSAQLGFYGTVFELNGGNGVVLDVVGTYGPGYVCNNTWFEANATTGSVTIDVYSGTYTGAPRDIYLRNTRNFSLEKTVVGKIELVNSHMTTVNCDTLLATGAGSLSITKDSSSTITHIGSQSDFWGDDDNLTLAPYANAQASAGPGPNSPAYSTLPGAIQAPGAGTGTVLFASTGVHAKTMFGNTSNISSSSVRDGMSFQRCAEVSLVATSRFLNLTSFTVFSDSITVTTGKWYVVTVQARRVSGTGTPNISFAANASLGKSVTLDHAEWRQYTIVSTPNATDTFNIRLNYDTVNTSVVRLGHYQVVEFDTQQQAAEYAYSGRLAIPPDTVREVKSASFPFAAQTSSPARASFNSANFCVNAIGTAAVVELFRADLGGTSTGIVVDMLDSFLENVTSPANTQNSGFRTLSFASTAGTTTSVFGAATVTFSWTLISGTTYSLGAQITAGTATSLTMAGIAFIKGK